MNRASRLQSARRWLESQAGRTPIQIARSYKKWFGLDWPCAIQELGMLGISVDPERVAQIYGSIENHAREKTQRKEAEALCQDSDETFAYIAGYTSGGAPYGITWEEQRQAEQQCTDQPEF